MLLARKLKLLKPVFVVGFIFGLGIEVGGQMVWALFDYIKIFLGLAVG